MSPPLGASAAGAAGSSVVSAEGIISGSGSKAGGGGSGAAATGSGSAAAGASSLSGLAKTAICASSCGSAGVGSSMLRIWSNILLTVSRAWRITSIKGAVTWRCPVRKRLNTSSATWHTSTRAVRPRNPAPPLTVWNPRKMAFSRSVSLAFCSSSTSCSDNCSSISPASTKKSCNISSSTSNAMQVLLRNQGWRVSRLHHLDLVLHHHALQG